MDSFLLLHPWLKLHPELTDNDLSLLRMQHFEKAEIWAKEVAQQLTAHTVLVFLIWILEYSILRESGEKEMLSYLRSGEDANLFTGCLP